MMKHTDEAERKLDARLALVKSLGFDKARIEAALASRARRAFVESEMRAADEAMITRLPTFVVGDRILEGAAPWKLKDELRAAIEAALKGT
jgi:predicted DsbA family dithiol-disulfide isomerase